MSEHDYDSELNDIAARLEAERPLPRPAFRGALGRHLESLGASGPAARGVRLRIFTYAGSGASMLTVAALGLVGIGPFTS